MLCFSTICGAIKNMNLKTLNLAAGLAGEVVITCRQTGRKLRWNSAALEDWVADADGTPYEAYYSSEAAARQFAAHGCNGSACAMRPCMDDVPGVTVLG
jgi:hypothetical protein